MSQRLLAEPLSEACVGTLQRLPVVQGVRHRRLESVDLPHMHHAEPSAGGQHREKTKRKKSRGGNEEASR